MNSDKSDLYYECHITFEPVNLPERAKLKEICEEFGFRVATFIMEKDSPIPDAFASARAVSYATIVMLMVAVVATLNAAGFKVKRYKIENTLLDTNKQGDVLGILSLESKTPG